MQPDLLYATGAFITRFEAGLESVFNPMKNEKDYETIVSILQYRDDTTYFWGSDIHNGIVIFMSQIKTMIKENINRLECIGMTPFMNVLMNKKYEENDKWNTMCNFLNKKFKIYSEAKFIGKQKGGYKRYGYYVMIILWTVLFDFNIIKIDDVMQKAIYFDEDVFFPFMDHIGGRLKNEDTKAITLRVSESLMETFPTPTTSYDNNFVECILTTIKLHWLFAHDFSTYEYNVLEDKVTAYVSKIISQDDIIAKNILNIMSVVLTRKGDPNIDIGNCLCKIISRIGENLSTNIYSVLLGFIAVGHYWHKNGNNSDSGRLEIKIPMLNDAINYVTNNEFKNNVDRSWGFKPIWMRSYDLRNFMRLVKVYTLKRNVYISKDLNMWINSGLHTI